VSDVEAVSCLSDLPYKFKWAQPGAGLVSLADGLELGFTFYDRESEGGISEMRIDGVKADA